MLIFIQKLSGSVKGAAFSKRVLPFLLVVHPTAMPHVGYGHRPVFLNWAPVTVGVRD